MTEFSGWLSPYASTVTVGSLITQRASRPAAPAVYAPYSKVMLVLLTEYKEKLTSLSLSGHTP